ncbi:MAG: hypothetical protein Q9221_001511 [Calogaya cf. arnoldii]
MGNTTPIRLTDDQIEWLDMKKRAAEVMDYVPKAYPATQASTPRIQLPTYRWSVGTAAQVGTTAPNIDLEELWDALESGENEYFQKEKRRVERKHREHPFHLDKHLPSNRLSGRLDVFGGRKFSRR